MITRFHERLPDELRNHKVALKLAAFIAVTWGRAQLEAKHAAGSIDPATYQSELKAINRLNKGMSIRHGEMKDFDEKLFDFQLRPGAARTLVAAQTQGGDSFTAYFNAYYKGNFVDRMGKQYNAPTIYDPSSVSLNITDTEISDAETVLLEFLIDLIDPTPVFGDKPNPDPTGAGVTFYPGGPGSLAPTVFTSTFLSKPSVYKYILTPPKPPKQNSLCGITTGNIWVLRDLAGGASAEAATVGGLVANSAGGLSLGLGAAFKLSIGDNQTLSVLVKTAASRVAMRASMAALYFALRDVQFNVPEP